MDRRTWCLSSLVVLATPAMTLAQPAKKLARVGWIGWSGDTSPTPSVPLQALRTALNDLGWKEGDNLVLDVRTGDREQGPGLAAELVRANVDVIVAQGVMVFSARGQSGSTPVVFGINGDPVEAGLVASLARPGGHCTGVTALALELAGKRLELLKSSRPGITRVAALANDRHPGLQKELGAAQAAAVQLGLELKFFPVRAPQDFDAAFAAIAREDVAGLFAFPDTLINRQAKAIAEFSTRQRLPSISGWAEFAHAGNLMSYGAGYGDFYRHLARYVDKLLRGAKPAELPVEQPTRFELVLNLKTATALGITVPQSLRLRANEMIE